MKTKLVYLFWQVVINTTFFCKMLRNYVFYVKHVFEWWLTCKKRGYAYEKFDLNPLTWWK